MRLNSVCLTCVAAVGINALSQESPAAEILNAKTPLEVAGAFSEAQGWKATSQGFGGSSDGNWTYATPRVVQVPADCSFEVRLRLARSADRRDGMELGAYAEYRAHANLGGYEAAVSVRHHSPQRQYRIAVSSLWKEIVLWRSTGGIVQVQSHPFEIGKEYTLKVTCRGAHLMVDVDGKPVIDWWDTADVVSEGTIALARKEGEAYFLSCKLAPEDPETKLPPAHGAQFREAKWHDGRWFFDGREPVFVLRDDNVLDHMKLRPGYRAAMYAFNFITDWNRFFPKKIVDLQVLQTGNRLVVETVGTDPDKPSVLKCRARLEVAWDPADGMYRYDHTCTVELPNTMEAALVSDAWDHGDAVFLGSVGSARTRDPAASKPLYDWSVFEAPDGKTFKVPHNHNGHYAGRSSSNGGPIRQKGGRLIGVGDPVLSPTIQFTGKHVGFDNCSVGLCWWAYDVHTLFSPRKVAGVIPPGTYVSSIRYTGLPAADARKLLAGAALYEPLDANVRVPLFTAGVGEREPFDKEVLLASPHTEHRIWAGRIDRSVGHGDRSSLRLDGPTEAWTLTGPSYFVGAYGKRNRVTAWIRTKDVGGEGPTIGFHRLDNNTAEFHATRWTGSSDWRKLEFETSFPGDSFGVLVAFRNSGSGTVWFDDFQIEPLPDDAPSSPGPSVLKAAQPDLVLNWQAAGDANSLLDSSGLGHHCKVFGHPKWENLDGKRTLHLDGETNYVWPLMSPHLTLGPETTVLMDLKPQAAGFLICWGFQYTIGTVAVGNGDQFAIEYLPASGQNVQSRPVLNANVWQHLALVMEPDAIRLYRDGTLVDTLAVKPIRGNWSLHSQSTWHRHLSFFGMGPGDMGLTEEPAAYCWKGSVGSLAVMNRSLRADEIAHRQKSEN